MTWTFVRAIIRVFIGWAEAHFFLHKTVPQWMKDYLLVCESIVRNVLIILLVAPEALNDLSLKDEPNAPPAPVNRIDISIAEFRERLARLKAILDNPAEETARLKAALEAHNIRIRKIAGLRPMSVVLMKHDALVHACALSRITPQARPPPA